jgi:BirA family transcriptional regulator, biotin operon repressor / biotin---[acetyl-CoA-carboxylase] ligase
VPEAAVLAAALRTQRFGRTCELLDRCASTSDEASARAAAGAQEGLVIAANEQTRGRGRRGRVWHSPAGENLTLSLLLRPTLPAHLASPLTLLAGNALARGLSHLGFAPKLKWPNDVLLQTPAGLRKVAGILAEMASEAGRVRHVVLGVGINVNSTHFPDEIAARATSLALVRGVALERAAVLAAFLNAFEAIYDDFLAHGPSRGLNEWQEHAVLGQRCYVERAETRIEGVAEGVDDAGALLIRTSDGNVVPLHAGEVNWLGIG